MGKHAFEKTKKILNIFPIIFVFSDFGNYSNGFVLCKSTNRSYNASSHTGSYTNKCNNKLPRFSMVGNVSIKFTCCS